METICKLAEPADTDTLLQLMREYYRFDHLHFDEQVVRSALEKFIGNKALGRLWIIVHAGETVGYLVLTLGFSFEFGGYDAFIDEVYIRESQRGRGIGKFALQVAEEECRGLGVRALHLEVERENTNAQALYRKVGFVEHDRYLLTKRISPFR
ncbi:MAG: N-acetyltransferase family protein [Candidatus Binatia bacterium]